MPAIFPGIEWLDALSEKLNTDGRYNEVARNWEGDLFFIIEPAGNLAERTTFYLDLWHGKCRSVRFAPDPAAYPDSKFTLTASYDQIAAILTGQLNPMTAMLTNKLRVKGNLGYMMRNVPTVLDFVRCAQEITSQIL